MLIEEESLSVKISKKKRSISKEIISDYSKLYKIREEVEEEVQKSEEEELKERKKKLNFCVVLFLWLKKNWTEQIIFITKEEVLLKIRRDLEKGKTNISTRLERRIIKDIRDEKANNTEFKDVSNMKRTAKFITFWHMVKCYFGLFVEILCSFSEMLCYFFMIISMMRSAGFITLVYPFTVFGYALMEEFKPKRKFWYTLLIYTEAILLIKFLF